MAELCKKLESVLELAIREVFAETLVSCRNENGEESYKPIEEIEVGGNCTLEKMYRHKNASKSAPPRFCDIYMCLYVRNYTQ